MVRRGNLAVLGVAVSPKLEGSCPPKLVYMHVTSTSICMNFLVRRGNLAVFEGSSNSETEKVTPTKIGVHACYIDAYLHEFFEPIPID